MDLGIKGKSAIICASSRGLGKACAYSLAINGVNVTLNGRDESILENTKKEISELAPNIKINAVACDVSTNEGREKLLAAANNFSLPSFVETSHATAFILILGANSEISFLVFSRILSSLPFKVTFTPLMANEYAQAFPKPLLEAQIIADFPFIPKSII